MDSHFDELNAINRAREKERNEGKQGSMISYIGSTFGWLGSGVSSYGASYLGAPAELTSGPAALIGAEAQDGEEVAQMRAMLARPELLEL